MGTRERFGGFGGMMKEANEGENRKKPKRRVGLTLLKHYFYFTSGLQPVARVQAIEHAETVERAIGKRHFARQLLNRISRCDCYNAKPQWLCLLSFSDAHTPETADGFAKRAIGLRRAMLGCENKTKFGVQKTSAADKALARVLAVHDAVDVGEIGRFGLHKILLGIGRRAILAGSGDSIGDAFGCRRMRRQKVGSGGIYRARLL